MKILFIPVCFALFFSSHAMAAKLTVHIENIKKKNNLSPIALAIFASEKGFPDDKNLAIKKIVKKIQNLPFNIELSKGEYAIAIFHDKNSNKKLDTNFIGIPKEPFGFSNNPIILTGPPRFKKAKVVIPKDSSKKTITIKLKRFL